MVAKIVFIVFAQVVLMQSITAQYIGAYNGCAAQRGYARPAAALAASNGPGLLISSSSPTAPVGISVFSENAIDGALSVAGALPFLGTVALEGVLPTAGAGNVAYNCGTGAVGITAEDIAAAPLGYAAGPLGCGAGLGYGCGAGLGCGCGAGLGCGYGAGLGYGCGAGLGCGYGAGPLGCAGSLGSGPYGYGAGLGYGLCGAGAYGSGLYGGCRALL